MDLNNVVTLANNYININNIVDNPRVFIEGGLLGCALGIFIFGSTQYKLLFIFIIIMYVLRNHPLMIQFNSFGENL
jgi:hypothetical protein